VLILIAANTSLRFCYYSNNNFATLQTTNMIICAVATCITRSGRDKGVCMFCFPSQWFSSFLSHGLFLNQYKSSWTQDRPRQRFPTRRSQIPGCPKKDFQGSEMQFESASSYVLGCTFFKGTKMYERPQALSLRRTLSILIIPASILIKILNC